MYKYEYLERWMNVEKNSYVVKINSIKELCP